MTIGDENLLGATLRRRPRYVQDHLFGVHVKNLVLAGPKGNQFLDPGLRKFQVCRVLQPDQSLFIFFSQDVVTPITHSLLPRLEHRVRAARSRKLKFVRKAVFVSMLCAGRGTRHGGNRTHNLPSFLGENQVLTRSVGAKLEYAVFGDGQVLHSLDPNGLA